MQKFGISIDAIVQGLSVLENAISSCKRFFKNDPPSTLPIAKADFSCTT